MHVCLVYYTFFRCNFREDTFLGVINTCAQGSKTLSVICFLITLLALVCRLITLWSKGTWNFRPEGHISFSVLDKTGQYKKYVVKVQNVILNKITSYRC